MRMIAVLTAVVVLAVGSGVALAADMKPIHTQKTKEVVVTLASESGQWKEGKNSFVVEFTSAQDKKPVDAGKVGLNTSMTMQGMAPMIAGVTLTPVSREQAVVDVLGKVSSGEADAGVVYATDVKGSRGAVGGVEFPEAKKVVNVYPIARLADSEHPKLADEFVGFVRTGAGHRVLADAGFGSP